MMLIVELHEFYLFYLYYSQGYFEFHLHINKKLYGVLNIISNYGTLELLEKITLEWKQLACMSSVWHCFVMISVNIQGPGKKQTEQESRVNTPKLMQVGYKCAQALRCMK